MKRTYATQWGTQITERGVRFRLWAPSAKSVSLVVLDGGERIEPMRPVGEAWFEIVSESARAGTRYLYEINGDVRVPDPASRFQPEGPETFGEVIDPSSFDWPDKPFEAPAYHTAVIYELHVGTFTQEGTYEAAARRLDHVADLGITAIELMPLSQAPGTRNWGYDGVLHYAPAHSYGTPDDLKRFIVEAHKRRLAVLLDVVYNHFGPEGNYLWHYAPQFFSDRLKTPWGAGIDYSSGGNDPVRRYVIENACYWLSEYGFDGLRLDATPMIVDSRQPHILSELLDEAKRTAGRTIYMIAEDVKNEAVDRLTRYDGRWSDDAHHALHVAITGERSTYFKAFVDAPMLPLSNALTTESMHRVDYLQNHDQIGNRPFGERITALASPEAVRAAMAVLLLAPPVPLLFMGEEWAASSPFLFFCDFEPDLAKRVLEGRRAEFLGLGELPDPAEPIPDPSALSSYETSKLQWNELDAEQHREWLRYYRELLSIRRTIVAPHLSAAPAFSLEARAKVVGTTGIAATWRLDNSANLSLEANLGSAALASFEESAPGRVIFATHSSGFAAGTAPPWSVRWSFGE